MVARGQRSDGSTEFLSESGAFSGGTLERGLEQVFKLFPPARRHYPLS